MKRLYFLTFFIMAAFGFLAIDRLSHLTLDQWEQRSVSFISNGTVLKGTLVLPPTDTPPPVAVIVHGDGASTRFLDGALHPFANALLDSGIGVFSWDKPGVGESSGNWLDQSMTSRASEALTALNTIRHEPDIDETRVGFIGFSQAGWAVPIAAQKGHPAFSVIIGGAVNWRDQGIYFTRKRLEREGLSPLEAGLRAMDYQLGHDKVFLSPEPEEREAARQSFVRRNYRADAKEDLGQLNGPLLALWGSEDLNVDPASNSAIYSEVLTARDNAKIHIVPDATHALLKSQWFNYQTLSKWPESRKIAFMAFGKGAYANGALSLVSDWIWQALPPANDPPATGLVSEGS